MQKKKRIIDRALIDYVKRMRCVGCGGGPSDADHIRSRGSGGDDTIDNLWPLCRPCHTKRHKIGLTAFAAINPKITYELTKKGFVFDLNRRRWVKWFKEKNE